MADELLDIYTASNESTGAQKMKSEAHRDGLWHRAVHVWVYNGKGEVLLQLRSKDKSYFPHVWDISSAGHVGAGEDEALAAAREVTEELGIAVQPAELEFVKVYSADTQFEQVHNAEHKYVYLFQCDEDPIGWTIQEEEVEQVAFFDPQFVLQDAQGHPEKYLFEPEYWKEMFSFIQSRIS